MRHHFHPIRRRESIEPPRERIIATSRMPYPSCEGREEPDRQLIDNAIAPLMEHFDTVQIIATRLHNDGTVLIARGAGNIYARFGSVREWFDRNEEDTRCAQRRNNASPGDEFQA